jgi:tetratricopeptide (TPR) repeat protein
MFFADTYRFMEEWDKSIEESEKSILIGKKIGYNRMVGYALLAAIKSYCAKGMLETAEANLQQATEIFESTEDVLGSALALGVKGIYLRYKGEYDEALQLLTTAGEMTKGLFTPFWTGVAHDELGIIYMEKGDYNKAKESFEAALRVWEKLGNQDRIEKTKRALQMLERSGTADE